jgi:serine/threonine-protein kinase HipA
MIRKKTHRLSVFFRSNLVGHLCLDPHGRFVFQYDHGWLTDTNVVPLSISLPLQSDAFLDDRARPFFANLLPEAEIRRLISRKFHISEKNDYALLERIGGDCAGAVSILPEDHSPVDKPGYRELDSAGLHALLIDLPRRPLLAGEEGIRLSLAGAQNKLPVYADGDRISLATGNAPSSHIIKPPIQGFDESCENETFCMMLAGKLDLTVPTVKLFREPDRFMLVERYDRIKNEEGVITRIHQEDFCQALGIPPDNKYESEDGPSLQDSFRLLDKYSMSPAADRLALLRLVIFNFLIGNADAHAKNLALVYHGKRPSLAPFYDLISTMVYEGLTERMAMKIGGENRPGWIQTKHWERLAESVNIKRPFVLKMLSDMKKSIVSQADSLATDFMSQYGEIGVIGRILVVIRKNAG